MSIAAKPSVTSEPAVAAQARTSITKSASTTRLSIPTSTSASLWLMPAASPQEARKSVASLQSSANSQFSPGRSVSEIFCLKYEARGGSDDPPYLGMGQRHADHHKIQRREVTGYSPAGWLYGNFH